MIEVFTDADWAGDTKYRHHQCSRGSMDSPEHARSEQRRKRVLRARSRMDDLGMQATINLRCDAKAARALAQRQGLSKRTRHVKVKYLYVQDLVKSKEIEVSRVATETNLADMGTKHLPSHRLEFLKSLMGKSSENGMTFRAESGNQYDESEENSDDDQHG